MTMAASPRDLVAYPSADDLDEVPLFGTSFGSKTAEYEAMSHEQRLAFWKKQSAQRRAKRKRNGQCANGAKHAKPSPGYLQCDACREKNRSKKPRNRANGGTP